MLMKSGFKANIFSTENETLIALEKSLLASVRSAPERPLNPLVMNWFALFVLYKENLFEVITNKLNLLANEIGTIAPVAS